MKQYKRDKRSPTPSSAAASKTMSAIRSKNTNPEVTFRKLLWEKGIRGYRLHSNIPGRPDIVFPKRKIAIFIHGCYWHRCPKCSLPIPKSNTKFWAEKFKKNVARDTLKNEALKNAGWSVIVIWECDLKKRREEFVKQIFCLFE